MAAVPIDPEELDEECRAGGRALSETTALGSRVDLGGQWIGRGHHRVESLAGEYGGHPFPMHTRTLPTILDGSRRVRATSPSALAAVAAVAGVGAVIESLATELGPRVLLERRVSGIDHSGDHVAVRSSGGDVLATKVIVAVPPPLIGLIDFRPALPPEKAALATTTYMGSVYKAIAVYDTPFWRARGGGEILGLDRPARAVFDTTPPGGPGHLCFLIGGPEARDLGALDPGDRRRALLGPLADRLGREILNPAGWHEKAWHLDDHVGGAYMALPLPGTTAGLWPVASTPVGHIHWAGSETARDHPGYLDGAVESGERVADEVLAATPAHT